MALVVSGAAAVTVWVHGVDWITGIASEPAVVLTGWGLIAIGVSAVPGAVALTVFSARFPSDVVTIPAILVGATGAMLSALWVSAGLLWRGYLALDSLAAPVAVGSVATAVWAWGILHKFAAARPLTPSRRLVYGAAAGSLIVAYLVAARFALRWIADLASPMVPVILPVTAYAAAAGLVLTLGSQRSRHRLWVVVGRHLFRSKHDLGEVWIHLTELVSAARNASDLLARAAAFCRDVLCVPETSVWLTDASGHLHRNVLATAKETVAPLVSEASSDIDQGSAAPLMVAQQDARAFAEAIGATFACPLRLNGRLLGFIAVGARGQEVQLDDEDRRVVHYIAAQVASAAALYRLGEEIAQAREVESFHRLSAFVIHDLKNLVAQQSFVLENAAKFRGDPVFVTDALAAFEDSTNRMRGLITRLRSRDVSARDATVPCDLVSLIRELIAMPRLAQRPGCTVQLLVPEGVCECPVFADRSALGQVFTNLLVNAVESLPANAGEIVVTISHAPHGWRTEIRDTGRGVAPAFMREHLFKPFRTTKANGLGIGLYQCKAVVEAVGGTITVSSTENVGTTVGVTLPARSPSEHEETISPEAWHGQTRSLGC